MKVNSEHLYEYINDLATDEKVKFKVYYDDDYVTEIYWNGESFEWDTGTFTSEAFFNPLYDFEVIEEDKEIIKWGTMALEHVRSNECTFREVRKYVEIIMKTQNDIIDKISEMRENK